jgi:hypothetical protein
LQEQEKLLKNKSDVNNTDEIIANFIKIVEINRNEMLRQLQQVVDDIFENLDTIKYLGDIKEIQEKMKLSFPV